MSDLLFPYAATGAEPILAATRQWLERAVIGLNLCPFAKSVFVKKQVRYALTAAATVPRETARPKMLSSKRPRR